MKVQNSIIGRTRGLKGTAVFYDYFNKHIVRTRPFTYNRPSLPSRDFQEGKFAHVARLSKLLLKQIRVGWSTVERSRIPYHKCISYNMLYMPYEPDQKIITSASTFKISSGSLPLILENLSMHFSPGNIQVNTFPYDSLPEERANDFRIAVLFNARQQVIFETTTLTFRDQESFNFNVPTSLHDDDFVLLYYYVSDNFQEVTDSVSIQFWQ